MKKIKKKAQSGIGNAGFTLTELMVVIGSLAILFGLINVSLVGFYRRPIQRGINDILIADIRSQQLKAMTGDSNGGVNTSYGIFFSQNSYTLFKGSSYAPGDPSNFLVNLDDGLSFTDVTFPSSVVIFQKGDGEVVNWATGLDGVSITDSQTGRITQIKINRYGATY
jgi:prepilin-type N-terminal cleavage/methylation domain-containing protein